MFLKMSQKDRERLGAGRIIFLFYLRDNCRKY